MAFWLDLDSGNDSNDGLTSSTPKKTIAAALALFDAASAQTLYVRGTARHEWFTLTSRSNKTIERWPGAPMPWLTHRIITGTWTETSGGSQIWTRTIATGLSISAFTFGWGQAVSVSGGFYGFMRRFSASGSVTASGAKGKVHYNSGTGLVTAYFGGANPNTAGKEIGYSTVETTEAGIWIVGCSNITIRGFNIGPLPKNGGQFGWGIRWSGTTGLRIYECNTYDTGSKGIGSFGGSGNSSDAIVSLCKMIGCTDAGSPWVSHQQLADGTLNGHKVWWSTVKACRYRGIDDLVLDGRADTEAALGAITNMVTIYGHGDSGTVIAAGGLEIDGCVIECVEKGAYPFGVDQATAVSAANKLSEAHYPIIVRNSRILNFDAINWGLKSGSVCLDRCVWDTDMQVQEGFGSAGVMGIVAVNSADLFVLFKSCVIVASLAGASGAGGPETRMFYAQASAGGTKQILLVNSLCYNRAAVMGGLCGFFDCVGESRKYFESIGTIYAHRASGGYVYIRDSATALGGNAINDGLYWNVSTYAHLAGYNATAWFTNVDTAGSVGNNVLAANPLSDVTGVYTRPTSAVLAKNRATSTVVPTLLIGGYYAGEFGPYSRTVRQPSTTVGVRI